MRAGYYDRRGPAQDVIIVGDVPKPEPGPGEVLVRVAVAGLNPSDIKNRSGWGGYKDMPYPRIVPQNDGAGTIEAIGPGVSETRLKERVWLFEAQRDGRAFGTAAEFVVVPEGKAARLPDSASFELGACLGVPAITAHRCLFANGGVQGRTVLVQGGGGAVGHAAIQLARWAGAYVIATVSRPAQAQAARDAGAHLVIDRKEEDVVGRIQEATSGRGVDRIVEVAFEANLEANLKVLKVGGVISTYATGGADAAPKIPFYQLAFLNITVNFVFVYVLSDEARAAAIHDINAAIEAGALRPFIGGRFALSELAVAHDTQESGEVVGNIVIDVTA
ncbi:NADPH:quinone reductase-like Zn-dependent oxidoreductase [Rhizobium sp. PP-F2F-G36]|nr:NADPH:quinone reductase-like Zn-dependent oxidoreductase [Rhizobium sp. PP-F2F-G36]